MQPASEWLDKCVTGLTAVVRPGRLAVRLSGVRAARDAPADRQDDKIRLWPFILYAQTSIIDEFILFLNQIEACSEPRAMRKL